MTTGLAKKLIVAGGGTGGHIFPGIAVAQEWVKRGGSVLFVGTPHGQEGKLVPQYGFELKLLEVGRLKGGGFLQKIRTILGIPRAVIRNVGLLMRERPDVIFGIGGYASGPTGVAAWLLNKPVAIMDQNVHPGLANRILGRLARRVFVSFSQSEGFFARSKVVLSGNPVRTKITAGVYKQFGGQFCLFIFGGSQGALALNKKVLEAIECLKPLWSKLTIFHQATVSDLDRLKEFYRQRGIAATVAAFFDDMNSVYQQAHLVICRAGAGTLTELALCGKPAILVPYPFAADNHQKKNADVFVAQEAALLFEQEDLSGAILAQTIQTLYAQPERLVAMARKMRALARPEAARVIVDELEKLAM